MRAHWTFVAMTDTEQKLCLQLYIRKIVQVSLLIENQKPKSVTHEAGRKFKNVPHFFAFHFSLKSISHGLLVSVV